MIKTKIVCTIGPASSSEKILRGLIEKGMNVARLNFSHGSYDEHKEKIGIIRKLSQELNRPVAILQDLCGPKIRVGEVKPASGIQLQPKETFYLTNQPEVGSKNRVSVSYTPLPSEVKKDDRIMLADGLMELVVKSCTTTDIECEVITGGVLTSHKGINLPDGTINSPALTEKDQCDLLFGLENGVDYVGLSFVREADDIIKTKAIISEKGKKTPVIAKIEKHEALDNIDAIIDVADGIMVARGDLGVEIPLEKVPNVQKQLVEKANLAGKPVIIATQMLRSMVNSPRPTRAEATDVANAVLDGTDAVMLSEETAAGDYPLESVAYMHRIIKNAEIYYPHEKYLMNLSKEGVSAAVSYGACILSGNLDAAAIIATTRSGFTAAHISRFRPRSKIVALSPDPNTVQRLSLFWGCFPCFLRMNEGTDEMIEEAAEAALKYGYVSHGDQVVITAGRPLYAQGTTNLLWVKDL